VTIDDESFTDILPYISGHVHVKRATSQFVAVTGFGFYILWDGVSTLYITLDPFFVNKVSEYPVYHSGPFLCKQG